MVDWFRTADQQGAAAFEAGNHGEAAQRFEDPEWQAAARYREANYEAAVEALSELDSARAQYNLGNALARSGQLEQAIAAYDQALEQEPANEDAQFNRDLVQDLLDAQQNQPPPPQSDSESNESESEQSPQDESSAGQEESPGQETASNKDDGSSSPDESSQESSADQSEGASSESAQADDETSKQEGDSSENAEAAQPQTGTESAAQPSENETEEGLAQNEMEKPTEGTETDRPTPASGREGGESSAPETEGAETRRAVADALQPADEAAETLRIGGGRRAPHPTDERTRSGTRATPEPSPRRSSRAAGRKTAPPVCAEAGPDTEESRRKTMNHRTRKNRLLGWGIALALLTTTSAQARVDALTDRSEVALGEPIRLMLQARDAALNQSPDLTPLEEDFEVPGRLSGFPDHDRERTAR